MIPNTHTYRSAETEAKVLKRFKAISKMGSFELLLWYFGFIILFLICKYI